MKKNIALLIEDDQGKLLKIKEYISANGCLTKTAGSLEEALSMMALQKFDAVFIGMFMLTITGFEVAREIRKQDAETPLIIFYENNARYHTDKFSNDTDIVFVLDEKASFEIKKYESNHKNKKG